MAYWATLRQTAAPRSLAPSPAPLSVLKPIKAPEEELEQNLRSFFGRNIPRRCAGVRRHRAGRSAWLARASRSNPGVESRFVLSDASFGTNRRSRTPALRAAAHDLVLQTDASIRLRPGYLRALVERAGQRHVDVGCADRRAWRTLARRGARQHPDHQLHHARHLSGGSPGQHHLRARQVHALPSLRARASVASRW